MQRRAALGPGEAEGSRPGDDARSTGSDGTGLSGAMPATAAAPADQSAHFGGSVIAEEPGLREWTPARPATIGGDGRVERYVGGVLLILLAVGCAVVLRPFVSAVLWALILAFSTWPIYSRLEGALGGRRALAAALMVAFIGGVLLLPLAILGSRLAAVVTQVATLASRMLEHGPAEPPAWVATVPLIGPRLNSYWHSIAYDGAKLAEDLRAYVGPARDWILATAVSLGAGVTELILSLFIAFFLYCNGIAGMRAVRSVLVRVGGSHAEQLTLVAGSTIKGVVYGIVGTNLAEGLLAGLGLWAVGVPGALFLGFILFFLVLIPAAPALVFVPVIVWLAQQGATASAILLAVWYVLVFIVLENVLRSYLISRGSHLPLVLVFLGMLGGILAFGLLGIFVGPTLLAVGHALLIEWAEADAEPASG